MTIIIPNPLLNKDKQQPNIPSHECSNLFCLVANSKQKYKTLQQKSNPPFFKNHKIYMWWYTHITCVYNHKMPLYYPHCFPNIIKQTIFFPFLSHFSTFHIPFFPFIPKPTFYSFPYYHPLQTLSLELWAMANLGDIGVSAAINILGAFAFLLAFALLRIQPINDRVYFPKWYIHGHRSSPRGTSGNFVGKFVNLNFKTYLTFLNWMPQAMKMSEDEIINHAGLDSAVFLRIYILGYS